MRGPVFETKRAAATVRAAVEATKKAMNMFYESGDPVDCIIEGHLLAAFGALEAVETKYLTHGRKEVLP